MRLGDKSGSSLPFRSPEVIEGRRRGPAAKLKGGPIPGAAPCQRVLALLSISSPPQSGHEPTQLHRIKPPQKPPPKNHPHHSGPRTATKYKEARTMRLKNQSTSLTQATCSASRGGMSSIAPSFCVFGSAIIAVKDILSRGTEKSTNQKAP